MVSNRPVTDTNVRAWTVDRLLEFTLARVGRSGCPKRTRIPILRWLPSAFGPDDPVYDADPVNSRLH